MYDDIMTTGDAGSLIAWTLLVILIGGGVWVWKNRNK